jgi:hypothetical protein
MMILLRRLLEDRRRFYVVGEIKLWRTAGKPVRVKRKQYESGESLCGKGKCLSDQIYDSLRVR